LTVLPLNHRYHKLTKQFDGTEERGRASKYLDEKLVFEMVKNIKVVFGKKVPKGKKKKKTTESDDQRKEMGGQRKMNLCFVYPCYNGTNGTSGQRKETGGREEGANGMASTLISFTEVAQASVAN